jgi:hypothetical protein
VAAPTGFCVVKVPLSPHNGPFGISAIAICRFQVEEDMTRLDADVAKVNRQTTARLVLSLNPTADFRSRTVGVRRTMMMGSEVSSRPSPDAQPSHYDSRSDRAFKSLLSCRTISVVLRISASLRATPMVEAITRNRASISR